MCSPRGGPPSGRAGGVRAPPPAPEAVQLPEFQRAKTVLMNLDGPSRLLRRAALEAGKRIVLQTLTIRTILGEVMGGPYVGRPRWT